MKERPKREPRVRPDGRCARRGCDKKVDIKTNPHTGGLYKDPFCSTECCKLHYGIITPKEADTIERNRTRNKHDR